MRTRNYSTPLQKRDRLTRTRAINGQWILLYTLKNKRIRLYSKIASKYALIFGLRLLFSLVFSRYKANVRLFLAGAYYHYATALNGDGRLFAMRVMHWRLLWFKLREIETSLDITVWWTRPATQVRFEILGSRF